LLRAAVDEEISSRAWTTAKYPWLKKWVDDYHDQLDTLVEASHRPRCYFPSPTMLNHEPDLMISTLLPGTQAVRGAGRALIVRAMWHVGEQRPMDAWTDLLAMHRIARLVAQGPTMIDGLVAIAIDGMACDGDEILLAESKLTPEQARQILRDLNSLAPFDGLADSLDSMERLSFLDTVVALSENRGIKEMEGFFGSGDRLRLALRMRIDWNVALARGNDIYDRYVAAVKIKDYEQRQQALDALNVEIQQIAGSVDAHAVATSVVSPATRSETTASMLEALFLPALDAASAAQDRGNIRLELVRLAAALAVFRAEHNREYPAKLDELVPTVLDKLPVDHFHAKPFVYRRTKNGYLLYSTGPNGQDDGGSNSTLQVFQGRPFNTMNAKQTEAATSKMPPSADDNSIRVPKAPIVREEPPTN
jgi:hypothetical protein